MMSVCVKGNDASIPEVLPVLTAGCAVEVNDNLQTLVSSPVDCQLKVR